MCVTVLQWKCSLAILKWRNVKTWTTLSTFFYVFWHDTSKKRKKRILELWSQVLDQFGRYVVWEIEVSVSLCSISVESTDDVFVVLCWLYRCLVLVRRSWSCCHLARVSWMSSRRGRWRQRCCLEDCNADSLFSAATRTSTFIVCASQFSLFTVSHRTVVL